MFFMKLFPLFSIFSTATAFSSALKPQQHLSTCFFESRTPSFHNYCLNRNDGSRFTTIKSNKFGRHRALPILQSAKIVPIAYTTAAASLLISASKGAATGLGWSDRIALASTAMLTLFHLGPTNNRYLTSSKRAMKKLQDKRDDGSTETDKAKVAAARKWRMAVRIKVIGQFLGLVWMSMAAKAPAAPKGAANQILLGATIVMATNVAFYGMGAGSVIHDDMGNARSMNDATLGVAVGTDIMMAISALVASFSTVGSSLFTLSIRLFVGGAFFGAVEGGQVRKFFKNLKKKTSAV